MVLFIDLKPDILLRCNSEIIDRMNNENCNSMNNKQHDIIVMWNLFGFYHEKNMNICICRTKVTKREMITFVNYVTYVE